jgi:hypothetical protein
MTSRRGSAPLTAFQWSQKASDLAGLGGLVQVGVGVDEVVGAGVLGEEGQHTAGPLRALGHVVLFQRRVVAPVQDRVEVQVEDRLLPSGQPRLDHLGVQGGQEGALVVVGEPVGVAGQRRLLGQGPKPGQQPGGRVCQQVIDVGDPAGAGELERQQRQEPAGGGDDSGGGVAGRADQASQVQGHQVGQHQQQPGPGRVQPMRPGIEVQHGSPWQAGVAAGGGRGGALGRGWAAQQPAEPLLGEDLADAGAIQRGSLGGQPRRDLIGGQALAAQPDHPAADTLLGRRHTRRRAGLAGRGKQLQPPGAVLTHQVDHRPAGVAEAVGGLLVGQPVDEERAQRLVAAVVDLRGGGEPPGPSRCGGLAAIWRFYHIHREAVRARSRPDHALIDSLTLSVLPGIEPDKTACSHSVSDQ